MIPILGQGGNARLNAIARTIGEFLQDDRCTAEETITVMTVMLVKTAKHAGVDREKLFNYLAARWQDQNPAPIIKTGVSVQ